MKKKSEVIKIVDKNPNADIAKLKFKNKINPGEQPSVNDDKQIVDIGNINITKNEKILVDDESDRETYNLLDSQEDPDDVKSVWSDE